MRPVGILDDGNSRTVAAEHVLVVLHAQRSDLGGWLLRRRRGTDARRPGDADDRRQRWIGAHHRRLGEALGSAPAHHMLERVTDGRCVVLAQDRKCFWGDGHGQFSFSRSLTRSVPSRSDLSFSQTMSGSTVPKPAKVEKPQSVPAMTRSGPTMLTKFISRSAMSSGCSTKLVEESSMPGIST